ncbi:MAG: uracil-DNA glycosylase [Alphaproteobacteria bacterium]
MADPSNEPAAYAAAVMAWYEAAGVTTPMGDHPVMRLAAQSAAVNAAGSPPAGVDPAAGLPVANPATPATKATTVTRRSGAAAPVATPASAGARQMALAATDLTALEATVRAFDGCPLKETASTTVFGHGPADARIMLIGEAPGAEEDRTGVPFVGQSGHLLDRILAAIDLRRDDVRITNTLFWRPPGNRDPTPAERAACLPFVERHIALVQPDVLVLLGATAARTMLDRTDGISRLRGRWHTYVNDQMDRPADVLCTYHPAYLLRTPEKKRDVWRDFLMLKARLDQAPAAG